VDAVSARDSASDSELLQAAATAWAHESTPPGEGLDAIAKQHAGGNGASTGKESLSADLGHIMAMVEAGRSPALPPIPNAPTPTTGA
jgi:hypothetical protein